MQTYEAQLSNGEVLARVAAASAKDARRLAQGALSGHRLFPDWVEEGLIIQPAAPQPRRSARRAQQH